MIIVNFVFCDSQGKAIIPEEFFSFLNKILPFDRYLVKIFEYYDGFYEP